MVTGAAGSYMSFFLGGGGKQTFSFFSLGFSWLSKSPGAPQAAEKGTGIAHKHDADAAALLRRGCEAALCCDAAALKSLKGPTVPLRNVCISLTAMGMVEERHAQSCRQSLPNQVFRDVQGLLGFILGSRGGRTQQPAMAGL